MKSQKSNWVIDAFLLIGFLAAFYLDLTGLPIHQWLGVGLVILTIVHFINHWDWVKNVVQRFFGKTSNRTRTYALIDLFLMLGFVLIIETGLVISTWFNLQLTNYNLWRDIHVYSSISTLVLTVIKISMHWQWIVKTAKKVFPSVGQRVEESLPSVPVLSTVPQTAGVSRRQFLMLMGVVGLGSALAISNVISKEDVVQSSSLVNTPPATKPTQVSNTTVQSQSQVLVNQPTSQAALVPAQAIVPTTSNTTACVYRCPKGNHCSFPGKCGRYSDQNNNGKCDLGECL
jgi:hypothetical protein